MAIPTKFPVWLKKRLPSGGRMQSVSGLLDGLRLNTVCRGAHCPNLCECFERGTATFMILGDTCTRSCGFCAVHKGTPTAVEPDEPERVAEAARRLGLKYVVITSVTRDDLADGGAEHFASTIAAVRKATDARVEVLTPDFRGDVNAIDVVINAEPDVYNHNIETVPRIYGIVRPQADYARSLALLERVARSGKAIAKSGMMVGLGETDGEIFEAMDDLARVGCEMLTIGQYLRPSDKHLPIARFVEPALFDKYKEEGLRHGLRWVEAGPFVRSSYCAEAAFANASAKQ